jgi:hypothetical protein
MPTPSSSRPPPPNGSKSIRRDFPHTVLSPSFSAILSQEKRTSLVGTRTQTPFRRGRTTYRAHFRICGS